MPCHKQTQITTAARALCCSDQSLRYMKSQEAIHAIAWNNPTVKIEYWRWRTAMMLTNSCRMQQT